MITIINQHMKVFDAFSGEQIPGVTRSDTGTMMLKIQIRNQAGQVIRSIDREQNHFVRVNNDAPESVRREFSILTDPQYRPLPLV